MNTRALNSLADLICRAQENGRQTPMGIAMAIDSAGRHMSPEVAAELERLRVEVAALREERHSTNEALDDAVQELRRRGQAPAEPVMVQPPEDVAPQVQKLRSILAGQRAAVEDPHDGPLSHRYQVGRDLPEAHVPFAAESPVEPSGCRYCGIPDRVHGQQWKASVGWHQWTLPTDAQIKARMRARRVDRKGGA